MTVYQLHVDGRPSLVFADLADPAPWVDAARLVEQALTGRPVDVEAVPTAGITADTNCIVHFNAQQIVQEDDA